MPIHRNHRKPPRPRPPRDRVAVMPGVTACVLAPQGVAPAVVQATLDSILLWTPHAVVVSEGALPPLPAGVSGLTASPGVTSARMVQAALAAAPTEWAFLLWAGEITGEQAGNRLNLLPQRLPADCGAVPVRVSARAHLGEASSIVSHEEPRLVRRAPEQPVVVGRLGYRMDWRSGAYRLGEPDAALTIEAPQLAPYHLDEATGGRFLAMATDPGAEPEVAALAAAELARRGDPVAADAVLRRAAAAGADPDLLGLVAERVMAAAMRSGRADVAALVETLPETARSGLVWWRAGRASAAAGDRAAAIRAFGLALLRDDESRAWHVQGGSRHLPYVAWAALAFADRDWNEVARLAALASAATPDDPLMALWAAGAAAVLGETAAAAAHLGRIAPAFSGSADFEGADTAIAMAAVGAGDGDGACLAAARGLWALGRSDDALALLDVLVGGADREALRARAMARLGAGLEDEALQDLDQYCADHSDVGAELTRVRLLLEREPRAAVEAAERALELAPTLTEAHLALAESRLASGDPRRALDGIDRLDALAPGDADACCLRARALAALGERDRALDLVDQLLLERPGDDRPYRTAARVFVEAGETGAALTSFNRALDANVLSADGYVELAALLERAGNVAAALDALTMAYRLRPEPRPLRRAADLVSRVMSAVA